MSYGFNPKPKILVDPDNLEKPYKLLNNISYESKRLKGMIDSININKGYSWDGATIPKIFWSIVGSKYNPEYLPATLIHDWLCEHKNYIPKRGVYISSMIFKDILTEYKVPWYNVIRMTIAVYLWQKTQEGWN